MNECQKCGMMICVDCVAEYDYGGGYDGNGLTQWVCDPCLHPEAYIGDQFPVRHQQLQSLSENSSEIDEGLR